MGAVESVAQDADLARSNREILMDYRLLGRSGFKVPALTFGTGTFGGKGEFF